MTRPLLASVPQQRPASPAEPGRAYGGESLAERRARRRLRFLDAGLQVFGTTGYRTATVRQLCRQAELTDRYFYESFESTEDLLVAVYERAFDQFNQELLQTLGSPEAQRDPLAAVDLALEALFEMASDPRVGRVCWLEVLGVSARVDRVYTQTIERFAGVVIGFAKLHVNTDDFSDAEARMLGLAMIGAVSQPVTHWLLGGYREDRATMVAATSRVFRGVIDGLGPARA